MRKVKIITIILAIITVTLIAFGGIYVQEQNRMENKVKDYQLGRELDGGRIIELKIANESDSEEKEEEQNQEIKEIDEETLEKCKTIKKTIENRFNNLGAEDYAISLNEKDGTIRIELAEDNLVDSYVYYSYVRKEIKIKDEESKTDLIDDSMIKDIKYTYNNNTSGEYQVYLEVELNKEGQAKVKDILNEYALLDIEVKKIEDAKKESEEEKKEENQAEEVEKEETKTDGNNEQITKKIAKLYVGENTYDIDKIDENKLRVKIGSKTSNSTYVNSYMSEAAEIAMLKKSGEYPINYEIETNRYEYSSITKTILTKAAIAIAIILCIILVIYCIKYKVNGILISLSIIGFVSLFSLLIRYTNVQISIDGILAIIFIILLNLKINQVILSKIKKMPMIKEAINSTYKEIFLKIIPIMILTVVFCFTKWSNLNSFGLIMFWGITLCAIYNITVTKALLLLKGNK